MVSPLKIFGGSALAVLLFSAPVMAEPFRFLGAGGVFTNDLIGDGRDRWRTGSLSVAAAFGRGDGGRLGDIVELRFHLEAATAANVVDPAPGDRLYAGIVDVGLHTRGSLAGGEVDLGLHLIVTGPQTFVDEIQRFDRRVFGSSDDLPGPEGQIANGVHPTLQAEWARRFEAGPLVARPFLGAQAGYETFARFGFDASVGGSGLTGLRARDRISGVAYPVADADPGIALVVGADLTLVADSVLLPTDRGPGPRRTRARARLGLEGRWKGASGFVGTTWLGPEFDGQDAGQRVGTVAFGWTF